MPRANFWLSGWCCVAMFVLNNCIDCSEATADLVAYEGFDYDYSGGAISLVGQSGGFGFAEGWTNVLNGAGADAGEVVGGAYPGLTTSGGHGFMGDNNRVGRNVVSGAGNGGFTSLLDGNGNVGKDDTTLYLSFATRYGEPGSFWAVELHRDGAQDGERIFQTGQLDGGQGIEARATGAGNDLLLDSVPDTGVHFTVLRFDFASGGDALSIYFDPQIGTPEPATPTAEYLASAGLNLSFDRISFANFNGADGGQFLDFDEIRFGTTYASVTAVPEPTPLLFGGLVTTLVGLSYCGARLRKRMFSGQREPAAEG